MSTAGRRGWRVLAVDDEEAQRRLLVDIFRDSQFTLTVVASGQELLELARTEAPDLVLLDLRMPGMDGFEVLRRMRAEPGTALIPAIAVTANTGPDDIHLMEMAGFSKYLPKPYDVAHLRRIVEETLLAREGRNG